MPLCSRQACNRRRRLISAMLQRCRSACSELAPSVTVRPGAALDPRLGTASRAPSMLLVPHHHRCSLGALLTWASDAKVASFSFRVAAQASYRWQCRCSQSCPAHSARPQSPGVLYTALLLHSPLPCMPCQAVLQVAEWTMAKQDAAFPIGKTRLECIGVILCAVIMSIATFQVRETTKASTAATCHEQTYLPPMDCCQAGCLLPGQEQLPSALSRAKHTAGQPHLSTAPATACAAGMLTAVVRPHTCPRAACRSSQSPCRPCTPASCTVRAAALPPGPPAMWLPTGCTAGACARCTLTRPAPAQHNGCLLTARLWPLPPAAALCTTSHSTSHDIDTSIQHVASPPSPSRPTDLPHHMLPHSCAPSLPSQHRCRCLPASGAPLLHLHSEPLTPLPAVQTTPPKSMLVSGCC